MERAEIDVQGVKLSYQRQGTSAKTIVLLHGNSACKEVFHHQFSHFEGLPFSILAFDLPGHGASDDALTPEQTYTMPGYANILGDALKALSIQDHIIVGWSLGGNIAIEMAGSDLLQGQKAFKGMMIFGAPPIGPGMENVEKAYLPATFESAISEAEASSEQIDAYVRSIYGTLNPVPESFYNCARRTDGRAREIMVQHWLSGQGGHVQIDTVANWTKLICVLHGNLDPFVALDYLKEAPWKNLWRNRVIEFPDCGHAPFLEDPQSFNALLEQFSSDVL